LSGIITCHNFIDMKEWIRKTKDNLPKKGVEVLVLYKKSTFGKFNTTIATIEDVFEYYDIGELPTSVIYTDSESNEAWINQEGELLESNIDYYYVYWWRHLPIHPKCET